VASVDIDVDINARIARSADVQAEVGRRAAAVLATSKRIVHVDPDRDVAKDGPHLRDTLYLRQDGTEWHVGSDARHALPEEFGTSPRHGGQHSFLRAALDAARR
jgi:hypothetical protein